MFSTVPDTTTTGEDLMEKMVQFFDGGGIQWENVCGVCMDGAQPCLVPNPGSKRLAPQARGKK